MPYIYISDIMLKTQYDQNKPNIDTSGGQKIYGTLEVDKLIVQNNIPNDSLGTDLATLTSDYNNLLGVLRIILNQ